MTLTEVQKKDWLERQIPQRMLELWFCEKICKFVLNHGYQHPLKVEFGTKGFAYPDSRLLINPIFVAGLVTCRTMLNFLGIKARLNDGAFTLINRESGKERSTDVLIEHLGVPKVELAKLRNLQGDPPFVDLEPAIANTIAKTDKFFAHTSTQMESSLLDIRELEVTCQMTNLVFNTALYLQLDPYQRWNFPVVPFDFETKVGHCPQFELIE